MQQENTDHRKEIADILDRIEQYRERLGQTVPVFCKRLGLSERNYRNWIGGQVERIPFSLAIALMDDSVDEYLRIMGSTRHSQVLGPAPAEGQPLRVSAKDLGKHGLVRVGPRRMTVDEESGDEYVLIPRFTEVQAEGGQAGILPGDEREADWIAFKRSWVQSALAGQPTDFFAIHVRGESMAPTLQPADIIVVDKRDTHFAFESIYVVRLGNTLVVKRVRKGPGTIELISDNPTFGKQEVRTDQVQPGEFQPLGRVVWFARHM